MWYCGFSFSPNPAFTNDSHSCDPHRGVLTQFLFCDRNLLYCRLFPGEILTHLDVDPPSCWADASSVVLGRGWNVSICCRDGFSSLFIGLHAHIYPGCVVYGLLANQTGKHEWSKMDIFRWFDYRCRGLWCVYQSKFTSGGALTWGSCSNTQV